MPLGIKRMLRESRRKAHKESAAVRVLMVCRVNYCRSPIAEGVFGQLLARNGLSEMVFVDSAGTHGQEGSAPDTRGQQAAMRRGINIGAIRSRPVTEADLDEFDYVLVMDKDNLADVLALCRTPAQRERVRLILDYASPRVALREVPDPYFGGKAGFERVLDLLEDATQGLLTQIRARFHL